MDAAPSAGPGPLSPSPGGFELTDHEQFDLRVVRDAVGYQRWVLEALGGAIRGDVLEAGAGIGNFTRWLAPMSSTLTVVEPDPSMAEEIRALDLPNVTLIEEPLERIPTDRRFDSVVLINLLEHLEDDAGALRVAHRALSPGGRVGVLVPAHRQLFGSLDHRYRHLRRYDRSTVRGLLAGAGFEVAACRYFNPVGAVGWWWMTCHLRRPRLTPLSVKLAESIAVPAGRLLGRLGDPPFGQSVVAVGRRGPEEGGRT